MVQLHPGLIIDGRAIPVEAPELVLRVDEGRVLLDLFAETSDGTSGIALDGLPLPNASTPETAMGRCYAISVEEVPELADAVVTLADEAMLIDTMTLALGTASSGCVVVQVDGLASIWGGRSGIVFRANLECAVEISASPGDGGGGGS